MRGFGKKYRKLENGRVKRDGKWQRLLTNATISVIFRPLTCTLTYQPAVNWPDWNNPYRTKHGGIMATLRIYLTSDWRTDPDKRTSGRSPYIGGINVMGDFEDFQRPYVDFGDEYIHLGRALPNFVSRVADGCSIHSAVRGGTLAAGIHVYRRARARVNNTRDSQEISLVSPDVGEAIELYKRILRLKIVEHRDESRCGSTLRHRPARKRFPRY